MTHPFGLLRPSIEAGLTSVKKLSKKTFTSPVSNICQGLSIYYVIRDEGAGVFPIYYNITQGGVSSIYYNITEGGGLQNLLQYYSFERKMEGYNPFSALNKLKGFHFILFNVDLCLHILSQIRKNVANTRFQGVHPDYHDITQGGSLKFITILQGGGVFLIYYNITRGRGGSLGTPNLYYVIYGRPLKVFAVCVCIYPHLCIILKIPTSL